MTDIQPFFGFPKKGIKFLKDLARNNNREWFQAHREDYQTYLLNPAQSFVVALGERLKALSSGIIYDTRTSGSGSILRIYRDIRFSKDKTPYHTNLRIFFWEGTLKKFENPGIYFAMDANSAQIYLGQYTFSKELLTAYRDAVINEKIGSALERALQSVRESGEYEIGGEHYKRVPRGYDPEHVRAPLLLYNGLHVGSPQISHQEVSSPDLVEICFDHCVNMAPVHHWLVRLNQETGSS
jgi:uncharacterized protein (TIGR02453 family)